ncbi:segregation/condensation protein A [Beduini massiliensis]|uniref:segregation/condensation protein A n=1 Tax=Beduini massiliensis TaxID=1585974 RepID=UPI00059AA520|nr:segregation/condensation protein A [Beduini massiliensis]
MEEYRVSLDQFVGPLDLLLHLIKEKEMDLENLELSKITDQYLDYLHQYQAVNLEVASEYLVMASSLIELKSKMLLPIEVVKINEDYEEDPREALIKRLIEYKKYKDVVENFKEHYESRQQFYIKSSSSMEEYAIDTANLIPDNLQIYDLMKAMQKMYQRKILSSPLITSVGKKEISIDDRCDEIRHYFKNHRKVNFEELFDHPTRHYFVVTFLAILTLANKKELAITQEKQFDQIFLEAIE